MMVPLLMIGFGAKSGQSPCPSPSVLRVALIGLRMGKRWAKVDGKVSMKIRHIVHVKKIRMHQIRAPAELLGSVFIGWATAGRYE